MIRAILKKGKIQPLDELPRHWRDDQELIVEGCEPSDDPADIKAWHDKLVSLSAQIPAEDHERMAAAVADQNRQAKARMRRHMGLD
jgi:enamine deaminase RidA (YjgF/YER057c/UK114 family)